MRRTRDERGATAVEYAVIVALVSVVTIGGLTAVGGGAKSVVDRAAVALAGSAGEPEFSCEVGSYDELDAKVVGLNDKSYYEFHVPAKEDPVLPDMVRRLTVQHPDTVRQWLACGGTPTLFYNHLSQINFRFRITRDGDTTETVRPGQVHNVTYQLANPQVVGDQVVFADSGPVPDFSWRPWYDPTREEEIQLEAAKMMAERSADSVEVTPIGKGFDTFTWVLNFQSHYMVESAPFPTRGATFRWPDGWEQTIEQGNVHHTVTRNY